MASLHDCQSCSPSTNEQDCSATEQNTVHTAFRIFETRYKYLEQYTNCMYYGYKQPGVVC